MKRIGEKLAWKKRGPAREGFSLLAGGVGVMKEDSHTCGPVGGVLPFESGEVLWDIPN
jgi:hypothetical protein